MRADQAIALVRPRLEEQPGIVAAWLFGSVARETARADSDVDVAILCNAPLPYEVLFDLQADLTRLLECEAQVVDARVAPVDLVHRVFRDGVLVVDRDRGKRIAFEVDARNRYFDMRPILLDYRRPRTSVLKHARTWRRTS